MCVFYRPTFWRIIKKKDVEQFQYYPYVATVLNCLFWVFYGLPIVKPDSILIVTINGVGLVIELIYLSIYLFYAKDNKKRVRSTSTSSIYRLAWFGFGRVVVLLCLEIDTYNQLWWWIVVFVDIAVKGMSFAPCWSYLHGGHCSHYLAGFPYQQEKNILCGSLLWCLQYHHVWFTSSRLGKSKSLSSLCVYT